MTPVKTTPSVVPVQSKKKLTYATKQKNKKKNKKTSKKMNIKHKKKKKTKVVAIEVRLCAYNKYKNHHEYYRNVHKNNTKYINKDQGGLFYRR
jgi:hypothetical protein